MSDYSVIADVGESMVDVLWQEIQGDPQVNGLIDNQGRISLQSPYELREDESVRISIYLYRVGENPHTKNQFPVEGLGGRSRKPPLTLDLFYMVTPLLGSPFEQQTVLGKVLRVFYDRAILEGADLSGALGVSGEPVHLMLNPVTLEETTRVWQALDLAYRLSVCYIARVAMVDSTREQAQQRVVARDVTYGGGV